jgi:hypothetical protein
MTCPQCQQQTDLTSGPCPSCGAPLPLGASSAPPPSVAHGAPAGPAQATASGRPQVAQQFSFDVRRLSQADRIAGTATLVLFISLFLPWFGASSGVFTVTVDGLWHGWMYIVLVVSLAVMAYLALRAGFAEMPFRVPVTHDQALVAATGLSALLAFLGFILKPSGASWQWGAFVGLIAALVAAAPFALPAIRARTSRGS